MCDASHGSRLACLGSSPEREGKKNIVPLSDLTAAAAAAARSTRETLAVVVLGFVMADTFPRGRRPRGEQQTTEPTDSGFRRQLALWHEGMPEWSFYGTVKRRTLSV